MGGKGGKRKGGVFVVPSFGAGGMRTPSTTPSASGSVAGAELAFGLSYDVPVKVPRVSVADVSVLSEAVGPLEVSPGWAGVGRLLEAIRNLRLVPEVRAHLLEGVRQLREVLEKSECWAIELSRLQKVAVEREEEMWKAACEVRSVRVGRDTAKAELESARAELVDARRAVDCEELKVWRFGAPGSLEGDILIVR